MWGPTDLCTKWDIIHEKLALPFNSGMWPYEHPISKQRINCPPCWKIWTWISSWVFLSCFTEPGFWFGPKFPQEFLLLILKIAMGSGMYILVIILSHKGIFHHMPLTCMRGLCRFYDAGNLPHFSYILNHIAMVFSWQEILESSCVNLQGKS